MKHSKRCIKKLKKNLINKKSLNYIINHDNLCRHAIKELKLANCYKGKNKLNDLEYKQILETIAVFCYHNDSSFSILHESQLVKQLLNYDVITPLRFTNDEWKLINKDGTCQNIRNNYIFKYPDGRIHYINAFVKRIIKCYSCITKEWVNNKNHFCFLGGLFECKNNVFTGRYFDRCNILYCDVENGWMPKEKIKIDCVEIEISPDSFITIVDADNFDLFITSCNYDIVWKDCSCLKDVRFEDVTSELIQKAYGEMQKGYGI